MSCISARIRLQARACITISLRTIAGVWQRSTSRPSVVLISRKHNSTAQRRRPPNLRGAPGVDGIPIEQSEKSQTGAKGFLDEIQEASKARVHPERRRQVIIRG